MEGKRRRQTENVYLALQLLYDKQAEDESNYVDRMTGMGEKSR